MAWNSDADRIKLNDDWSNIAFVTNREVDNFIESSDKFFIVAAKGIGKTLLLKSKSKHYRENKKAAIFYPKNILCEKLVKKDYGIFSKDDLGKFVTMQHWTSVWNICFMALLIKLTNRELPGRMADDFGTASSITDFMNILLMERKNLHIYTTLISKKMTSVIDEISESIAIFIDNIDECMDEHVGYSLKKKLATNSVSEDVWVNAQLGMMEAAKAIHFRNNHIKIYASIRIEAFNRNRQPTALQTEDYCIVLSYNKDELAQIFYKNIELMEEKDLVSSNANNQLLKFVGFDEVPHVFARQ